MLKLRIKSHKRQQMQTNHKEVVTKETPVTVERIGPRTSITIGPFTPKAIGETVGFQPLNRWKVKLFIHSYLLRQQTFA